MSYEVKLPDLGEDAGEEATVAYWLYEEGDYVKEGDDLVELTTDKAAFTVPSPRDGKIAEIVVQEGDDVVVGDVLCIIEAD